MVQPPMKSLHKKIYLIITFLLSFYGPIPTSHSLAKPDTHANPATVDYILNNVEAANKRLTSLKADITLVRSIELLESEEVSKGILTYQRPGRLHIRFLPPRNEINLVDGKDIWIYHIDSKQVEKYEIDGAGARQQLNPLFDLGLEESIVTIRDRYNISLVDDAHLHKATEDGKGVKKDRKMEKTLYALNLVPKEGQTDSHYSSIQLYIEEGLWLPVAFILYESGGEIVNRIELNNIEINKEAPEGLFRLDLPEDVEVIDPLQ